MSRSRPLCRATLAAALVPLLGCFYPAERGRMLEADVKKLQVQNDQLHKDLQDAQKRLTDTLPRVDEKLAEMQRALDGLDKASRRTDADIGVQMQKSVEDLAALRGQVETYLHRIEELEAALKRVNEDTDRKLTELQGSDAVKTAEAKRKVEELPRPSDKEKFLALADEKAKAGELLVARQLYGEFLKKWSKDPLSGDAHFGLGETFYSEEKCREALFEYGKVIQEFARSRSAPTAYLRSSDCFRRLKMVDESRLALEEVMKSYPKSDAAKTAKVRLAELEKEKTKKVAPAKKGGKK